MAKHFPEADSLLFWRRQGADFLVLSEPEEEQAGESGDGGLQEEDARVADQTQQQASEEQASRVGDGGAQSDADEEGRGLLEVGADHDLEAERSDHETRSLQQAAQEAHGDEERVVGHQARHSEDDEAPRDEHAADDGGVDPPHAGQQEALHEEGRDQRPNAERAEWIDNYNYLKTSPE